MYRPVIHSIVHLTNDEEACRDTTLQPAAHKFGGEKPVSDFVMLFVHANGCTYASFGHGSREKCFPFPI